MVQPLEFWELKMCSLEIVNTMGEYVVHFIYIYICIYGIYTYTIYGIYTYTIDERNV